MAIKNFSSKFFYHISMQFLQKSSKFINIIRSFMLMMHNTIKPVIISANHSNNGLNGQLTINSLPNLRKHNEKKSYPEATKKLVGDQRNSLQKRVAIFDNEFKKKYYSVCSQMLKIKHDWRNDIQHKGVENVTSSQGFYQLRISLKKQEKMFSRQRIMTKQIKIGYFRQTLKDKNKLKIHQRNSEIEIEKQCPPFRKSHEQPAAILEKQIIHFPSKIKNIFQPNFKRNIKKLITAEKQNSDLKGWIDHQDAQIHDFTYLF